MVHPYYRQNSLEAAAAVFPCSHLDSSVVVEESPCSHQDSLAVVVESPCFHQDSSVVVAVFLPNSLAVQVVVNSHPKHLFIDFDPYFLALRHREAFSLVLNRFFAQESIGDCLCFQFFALVFAFLTLLVCQN